MRKLGVSTTTKNNTIMKKLNLNNLTIYLLALIILASSCSTAKVTFTEVYKTELEDKQNGNGHFNERSQKFVGVSENNFLNGARKFTIIDTKEGNVLYSKNAKDFGENVSAMPAYHIDFNQNVIIFHSKFLTYRTLTAVDLNTGEELWAKSTKDTPFETLEADFAINWFAGYPLIEDGVFKIYNTLTGNVIWELSESDGIDIVKAFEKGNSNWEYLFDSNQLLLSANDKLASVHAKKGTVQWILEGEFGNLNESDLFFERGRALFYGPQGDGAAEVIGKELMRSSNAVGRIAGRAIRASNSGIQDNPLYYIDIENGKLLWETTFKTSGQTYPLFYEDILILSDLMTYALDEKTGEVLWQTVSEERLDNEENRRLVSEFTPFQLDASNRVANDNVIVDDNIFVVHSTIFDEGGDKEAVSIKRLNIRTGEEIWQSEPERIKITNFFFKHGRLFVQTWNRTMYEDGEMRALDPGSGEMLYEIKANSPIKKPFMTDHHIHFTDLALRLQSYDINTGKKVNIETPLPQTLSLEYADNFLLGRFGSSFGTKSLIAFVNPKTFQVERQVELPFSPANKMVKGGYLFLYSDSYSKKSLIAIDFDQLKTRGSFQFSAAATTTKNGQQVDGLPDVHYFISEDGENIYLTENKTFYKYKLAE